MRGEDEVQMNEQTSGKRKKKRKKKPGEVISN